MSKTARRTIAREQDEERQLQAGDGSETDQPLEEDLLIGPKRKTKLQNFARDIFEAARIELVDLAKQAGFEDVDTRLEGIWQEVLGELERMKEEDAKPDGSPFDSLDDARAHLEAFIQERVDGLREEIKAAQQEKDKQQGPANPEEESSFEVTEEIVEQFVSASRAAFETVADEEGKSVPKEQKQEFIEKAFNEFAEALRDFVGAEFTDKSVWDDLSTARLKVALEKLRALFSSLGGGGDGEEKTFIAGESMLGVDSPTSVALESVQCVDGNCELGPDKRKRFLVKAIEPGMSLNNFHYPAELLRARANLLDGVPVQAYGFGKYEAMFTHLPDGHEELQPSGFRLNRVGVLKEPFWVGPDSRAHEDLYHEYGEGAYAYLEVDRTSESWAVDYLNDGGGLSIFADIDGEYRFDPKSDSVYVSVEDISRFRSVDFASQPAAGGKILHAVESIQQGRKHEMQRFKGEVLALGAGEILDAVGAPGTAREQSAQLDAGHGGDPDEGAILAIDSSIISSLQGLIRREFQLSPSDPEVSTERTKRIAECAWARLFLQHDDEQRANDELRALVHGDSMEGPLLECADEEMAKFRHGETIQQLNLDEVVSIRGCGECGRELIAKESDMSKQKALEAVSAMPRSQLLGLRPDLKPYLDALDRAREAEGDGEGGSGNGNGGGDSNAGSSGDSNGANGDQTNSNGGGNGEGGGSRTLETPAGELDEKTLRKSFAQLLGFEENDPLLSTIVNNLFEIVENEGEEAADPQAREAVLNLANRLRDLESDKARTERMQVLEDALAEAHLPEPLEAYVRKRYANRRFATEDLQHEVREMQAVANGMLAGANGALIDPALGELVAREDGGEGNQLPPEFDELRREFQAFAS